MWRSFAADPHDLEMLNGVLSIVFERRHLHNLSDREQCAREIVALFANGVTGRNALLNRMGVIA